MKKREPIDLVGRMATRLDLNTPDTKAEAQTTTALRVAAVPPTPQPSAPAPRIVGREPPPPRVEPSFERRSVGVTRPDVPRAEPTEARIEVPPPAEPAPQTTPQDMPAVAAEMPPPATEATDRKFFELNLVRLQKEGFLTPQNQRSLIAEEYRIIKRPLLRAAFDQSANDPEHLNHVVMITSARPGEGKTFTAINLAMSVATERDLHVLLVDCDIRRMGMSKKLGVADRKGLMDVLSDPTVTLSDVILRTNVPNLAIIPSGQPVEASTEVFASAKMTRLVDDIARRYPDRFIIFDAPPVLASSEPGVLAVHVGQTVMVVYANETSKRAIAQSIPLIAGCPNINFVLNRVTLAAGPDRFGYYGTY